MTDTLTPVNCGLLADQAEAEWAALAQAADEPAVERLHAARPALDALFRARLRLAEDWLAVRAAEQRAFGGPDAGADAPAVARLRGLVSTVFDRWGSLDDLYSILNERVQLPAWSAAGPVPDHLRPPTSWCWEAVDPTEPAAR